MPILRADKAVGLTASWEIHARDMVPYALVTDGKLEARIGSAPVKPGLVITAELAEGELPSYRALIQAAKCGLVQLSGRRKPLDTFIRLLGVPQVV
ncbi:MAG TPA: hypothetical protein VFX16_15240 [Pseudonocardiaceae bacterium]|nr:hypothetical protein [Pseudonocardiaceae bacterium]